MWNEVAARASRRCPGRWMPLHRILLSRLVPQVGHAAFLASDEDSPPARIAPKGMPVNSKPTCHYGTAAQRPQRWTPSGEREIGYGVGLLCSERRMSLSRGNHPNSRRARVRMGDGGSHD